MHLIPPCTWSLASSLQTHPSTHMTSHVFSRYRGSYLKTRSDLSPRHTHTTQVRRCWSHGPASKSWKYLKSPTRHDSWTEGQRRVRRVGCVSSSDNYRDPKISIDDMVEKLMMDVEKTKRGDILQNSQRPAAFAFIECFTGLFTASLALEPTSLQIQQPCCKGVASPPAQRIAQVGRLLPAYLQALGRVSAPGRGCHSRRRGQVIRFVSERRLPEVED